MMSKTTLLALLFCSTLTLAQKPELQPVKIDESPVGFLGMVQDKYGYIWLADNGNGLFKYDGKKTVNYKPIAANPNSISSGRIENLIIDRDGIFWLAHFGAGLDRFDSETDTFTHYVHDDNDPSSIYSNGTRDIVEDLDGNIWVGTNAGVDKFDKETGKFNHNFSDDTDAAILRGEQVRKMYVDKSGIIWIGTGSAFFDEESEGGLFKLNPRTGEIDIYRNSDKKNSLTDNRVRAIFEDSKGIFWVGTAGDGLHTMNRENGTFTRHTYDPQNPNKLSRPPIQNNFDGGVDHITFINEDNENNIWIGTFENGLNRYNPSTQITQHYGPNELGKFKTANSSYWGFLKTREAQLWFASFSSENALELLKLDDLTDKYSYFEYNNVSTFKQDKFGTNYIGLPNGVYTLNNEELNNVFKINALKDNNEPIIREINIDNQGNIWAGTFGEGLFFYNIKTKELKNYKHEIGNQNSLSNNNVGSILIQENGEVFIGTISGLNIFNTSSNKFEHYHLETAINSLNYSNSFKIVTIDGQGRIWVGGLGGIFRFEREKGIFIKYDLGFGSQFIISQYIDSAGVMWIGTINHGLRRYNENNDSFESIIDETGFLNKYSAINSITQDQNNELWIDTFGDDIIKYNIKSNLGSLFKKSWFVGNKLIDIQKILTLNNGELLMAGFSGYVIVDPNNFKRQATEVQKPFIEKLMIGMKTLSFDYDVKLYKAFREESTIKLSHNQNDLSFKIGYIDYDNSQDSQTLTYKLENYDTNWRSSKSGDMATYYHLPTGEYRFIIKAQDIYGNWGDKKLLIEIVPPWYLTTWAYIVYFFSFISGVIFVHKYQKNRLLKKAKLASKEKELLQAKKIKKAYDELAITHDELKTTQSQLIQSEKMASLGELTAGIAHEIQNPLNFVNNFSEVNTELIDEMQEELKKEDYEEVIALSKDIRDNQQKINHHGKRADAIVKGMLQHSRSSGSEKEPSNINAIADEYLRLAYHGLRAKDKSFNATMNTDFDESIGKINIVPQDVGRVILNLITNAFHAVTDRRTSDTKNTENEYEPTVWVTTKRNGDTVHVSIKDNGNGVPEKVKDKIFQPFFTTKPSGQGTGLGLSLSYDIIKTHGGELLLETKQGVGTTFTITLPGV